MKKARRRPRRFAGVVAAALVVAAAAQGLSSASATTPQQMGPESKPLASSPSGDVKPFTVRQPKVSAEIPSTATEFPFNAYGFYEEFPLPKGYKVSEYFISGEANIYEYTPTGVKFVAPCPASVTGDELPSCTGLPYKTRMVVYAPKDRRKFSGNVWVNPFNPSAGYDYGVVFSRQGDYFARKGDIFVNWTAKSVAVDALKQNDPDRYDALHWPYEPETAGANSAPYDGITYDVAAQVGALFQENGPRSPVHGYSVKRVFETGFSQDGGMTFTFANIFHELQRMRDGGPVYEGYLPQGMYANHRDLNYGISPTGELPEDDPRIKMQPRSAPVIKTNTENEIIGTDVLNWRRPDSDARNDRYREWEVGGGGHDDLDVVLEPSNMKLFGSVTYPMECDNMKSPSVSPTDLPYAYVANAAAEALVNWVTRGVRPARAAGLDKISATEGADSIRRDKFGNAVGGVRFPHFEVPHSTYVGTNTGPGYCGSNGYRTTLSESVLESLYDTHEDYLRQFKKSAALAVARGVWLREDALEAVKEASGPVIGGEEAPHGPQNIAGYPDADSAD